MYHRVSLLCDELEKRVQRNVEGCNYGYKQTHAFDTFMVQLYCSTSIRSTWYQAYNVPGTGVRAVLRYQSFLRPTGSALLYWSITT